MSTWGALLRRGHLGTQADRAAYRTLHTALLASPPLRAGLTPQAAERALKHLRSLLGAPAVAMTDTTRLLAWEGGRAHHAQQPVVLAAGTLQHGRATVVGGARPSDERGGPVGVGPTRAGRARRVADPTHGGRGARPAGPDQPALRLQ